ncbi:MAG: 6-carboxytetrahydropterin synthase [Phycisphaerales bacterium]|jgi:6-pyruvoyltetrahydropterin/6-carboxytetrahydropterin synthase
MHKLARQVRFSINPFLPEEIEGFNSYASKPTGEGLSIFLELSVEVEGKVAPATGFVVNVTDIDKSARELVVPVFAERIRQDFRQARHIGFFTLTELLKTARSRLADKFEPARLNKLSLKLNPLRKIVLESKDLEMVYFSEKFEFAATHKLWNDDFSEKQNLEVFGKCANPAGHGHNYSIEVTIKMPAGENTFKISDFQKTVDEELIQVVDHKNLNAEVSYFNTTNPTVENIATFAWNTLAGKFDKGTLHCVTVWETDKTYSSYYGQANSK